MKRAGTHPSIGWSRRLTRQARHLSRWKILPSGWNSCAPTNTPSRIYGTSNTSDVPTLQSNVTVATWHPGTAITVPVGPSTSATQFA